MQCLFSIVGVNKYFLNWYKEDRHLVSVFGFENGNHVTKWGYKNFTTMWVMFVGKIVLERNTRNKEANRETIRGG